MATHVTQVRDSFGYSSSATHNYHYGSVETSTDENRQRIVTEYDKVGRVRRIVGVPLSRPPVRSILSGFPGSGIGEMKRPRRFEPLGSRVSARRSST